jgi:hypothetical protein
MDGWIAEVEINKTAFKKKPILFLTYNDKITNIEFFLEDTNHYQVKLNLPDGYYDYLIKDSEKNILEKGKLDLIPPFTINIKEIASDHIGVTAQAKSLEFIDAYLYLSNEMLTNQKVLFTQQKNAFDFFHLASGTLYTLECKAKNYLERKEFKTLLKNIALNKPVTGTFTKLPESKFVDDSSPVISRINDGKINWLSGMAASGEVNANEQYVFINLLKQSNLKEVKVYWHAYYNPLKYSFYFSLDGTNWNTIERSTNQWMKKIAPDNTPVIVDHLETNMSAQYIGIIIKKGEKIKNSLSLKNYLELLEIEAYE